MGRQYFLLAGLSEVFISETVLDNSLRYQAINAAKEKIAVARLGTWVRFAREASGGPS